MPPPASCKPGDFLTCHQASTCMACSYMLQQVPGTPHRVQPHTTSSTHSSVPVLWCGGTEARHSQLTLLLQHCRPDLVQPQALKAHFCSQFSLALQHCSPDLVQVLQVAAVPLLLPPGSCLALGRNPPQLAVPVGSCAPLRPSTCRQQAVATTSAVTQAAHLSHAT